MGKFCFLCLLDRTTQDWKEKPEVRKDYLDAIAMMRVKLSQSCWESLATPHARPDKGKPAAKLEVREKSEEVMLWGSFVSFAD